FAAAVVAGAELMQETARDIYNEHFPPLQPNCSQSLTDLLLLRQEVKLDEMVKLLTDIRDLLEESSNSASGNCPVGFENAEGLCLHLGAQEMTWENARRYCQTLGGSLATGLQNVVIGRSFVRSESFSLVWLCGSLWTRKPGSGGRPRRATTGRRRGQREGLKARPAAGRTGVVTPMSRQIRRRSRAIHKIKI
ncbi:uncharacterized protein LOC119594341, partial [Penaeus monodon]|uniref:uncharacterized protein LOC119594341 n=1 Tax=Penaeus monodon TaxID=6687 RepID=UPI0018A7516A